MKINGADPDFHRRDLWQSIKSGNFPEWELCVQLFDRSLPTISTSTSSIDEDHSEEILPVKADRTASARRMPDNFFAETEQGRVHDAETCLGDRL